MLNSYQQFKKDFKDFIMYFVFGIIFWVTIANLFEIGYDSTDSEEGRSGLRLFTDDLTGCQYLGTAMGGITPRLNEESQHICDEEAEIQRLQI